MGLVDAGNGCGQRDVTAMRGGIGGGGATALWSEGGLGFSRRRGVRRGGECGTGAGCGGSAVVGGGGSHAVEVLS